MFKKIINKLETWRFTKQEKKLNRGKYKSFFLKTIIIKHSYKPPIREKIIKLLIIIGLKIGVFGTKWSKEARKKEIVNDAYDKIISPNFIFVPAAFAFSLIMAFIPIISIILLIIGSNSFIGREFDELSKKFLKSLSSLTTETENFWAAFKSSPTAFFSVIITMLTSLWIASAGIAKFVFSVSLVYNHDKFGGFWMNRLRGMSIILAIAFYTSGYIALLSGIAIGLHDAIASSIAKRILFQIIVVVITLPTMYFGFGLFYKLAPRFKLKWREVHIGVVIAIVPTFLFLVFFSTINQFILSYSTTGGILSLFMTLAMSLLIFSYFVYVGVIANAAFYNTHVSLQTKRKKTISQK